MKHRIIIAFAATAGLLLAPLSAVRAMTVSPVLFEFDVAKGTSKQETIKIWNDTEQVQTYSLAVQNFVATGEDGAQEYLDEKEPTGLASWVIVDRPTVTLQPGESADFPFAVNVPADAEPGGHYATVFFAVGSETAETGVGIASRTGVLLLVNVPGEIREDARVESFRLMGGGTLSRLPATFELRIRNLGSTHFRPRGTLVIRNLLGSVVTRVAANPKSSAVLPQSVRRVYSVWANTMEVPSGGFWTEMKNEWRNFAFGRYTATVDMTYGSKNATIPTQTATFWVFPWRLTLIAALAVVAMFLLLKGYNTLIVRAALKRSGKK
ncbi:MAG TPA: hypothetical protein VN397_04035 [Candidatus Methylomirabilis sp.]|nr:hypothetical protein [Candidatus Methylomirabilis sp.]